MNGARERERERERETFVCEAAYQKGCRPSTLVQQYITNTNVAKKRTNNV